MLHSDTHPFKMESLHVVPLTLPTADLRPSNKPIEHFSSLTVILNVDICQKCGDRGFVEALNFCNECQTYPIHRYCLDELPKYLDEYVPWLCEDCEAAILPTINSEVKLKKKKQVKQLKKKKKKKKKQKKIKGNDDCDKSSYSLQLPEAHCSENKNESTPGRLGEPVLEDGAVRPPITHTYKRKGKKGSVLTGANHGQVATSSDMCNSTRLNCYVAQPIVDPVWRGTLKFWNRSSGKVCVLVAHMSSLACSKVYEEAKMLPVLLSAELFRRCDVWPRGFQKLGPTDQNIALYFFPDGESQKAFDLLVNAMMSQDLAMKAVLKNAELLVFTSSMLPMRYWRFQTKYYLWGVFRGKQTAKPRNVVASEERTFAESTCMQGPISPDQYTSSC
ncbi:uncharacterized protein LOC101213907 isoform X2 [Cucumis sativus]|uniref:uncharacterized protein LOC101213907 isoform X2 n=1 Tax=Cucumis sativus TaxID=3659 RepID=UPI0005EC60A0|nr:uncharacterized protein LOC101213907 isoform X2 [Cucumis sativus]KAE8646194.1 hypothetical protein Csa_016565 [Cucumis sativus]